MMFVTFFMLYLYTAENLRIRGVSFDVAEYAALAMVFLYEFFFSCFYGTSNPLNSGYIFFLPSLIVCTITDVRERFVFDSDIISGIILVISDFMTGYMVLKFYGIKLNGSAQMMILSVLSAFLLSFLIMKITGAMGEGDVFFYTFLGFIGNIYDVLLIFLFSFLFASLYSVYLLIKGESIHRKISFVPFISLGFTFVTKIYIFI